MARRLNEGLDKKEGTERDYENPCLPVGYNRLYKSKHDVEMNLVGAEPTALSSRP